MNALIMIVLAHLAVGAQAPSFSAESSTGKTVKSSDFKGHTIVLAFFPKAFTGG